MSLVQILSYIEGNVFSREDGEQEDTRQDLLYVLVEWLFLLCDDSLSGIKQRTKEKLGMGVVIQGR